MENLSWQDECRVTALADQLAAVDTIEDLFPPEDGDQAVLRPFGPDYPGDGRRMLAAVIDLAAERRRRNGVMQRAGNMIVRIDELVRA